MELHSQSVLLQRNLPRPPSPQEVFEIEPEESVNVKNEEDEEKVKVEKPKYWPKIVKGEPRPVSDSSENNPTVQKCPKIHKAHQKKGENLSEV